MASRSQPTAQGAAGLPPEAVAAIANFIRLVYINTARVPLSTSLAALLDGFAVAYTEVGGAIIYTNPAGSTSTSMAVALVSTFSSYRGTGTSSTSPWALILLPGGLFGPRRSGALTGESDLLDLTTFYNIQCSTGHEDCTESDAWSLVVSTSITTFSGTG